MILVAEHGIPRLEAIDEPRVLRVGPRQDLRRVRDVADQVGHRALGLGHRRHQRGRARGLRQPDVEAHVGEAVGGEVVQRRRPSRPRARSVHATASASARSAASTATPSSTASRTSQRSRQSTSSSRAGGPTIAAARRRTSRRRGPAPRTGARTARARSMPGAGWSGQCRALLRRSSRSGGQAGAGWEQPELDRGPEAFQRLLECRGALDRREDACRRSQPLEPSYAFPVGDGRLEGLEFHPRLVR